MIPSSPSLLLLLLLLFLLPIRNAALARMTASVCDTSAEDRIAVMQMVAEGEIDLDEVRHSTLSLFLFWTDRRSTS